MKHGLLGLLQLAIALAGQCFGQLFEGTVQAPDGTPISYATVIVANSSNGTLTDENGKFSLSLKKGTHILVIQHLGYATLTRKVSLPLGFPLILELQPEEVSLKTIEIKAGKRDPAYGIIKRAIRQKKDNQASIFSYRCTTYQKISLLADTLPGRKEIKAMQDTLGKDTVPPPSPKSLVTLIESQSISHFQQPNQYKSNILAYRYQNETHDAAVSVSLYGESNPHGYRTVTNDPYLFYTDISDADFDFYENLIEAPTLSDQPLVSPLHSLLWNLTYTYKLEETLYRNNRVFYRISLKPINKMGPCFSGELLIEDGSWAITGLKLTLAAATLNYFKEFSLSHTYERQPSGQWLLMQEQYTYLIKDGKTRLYGNSLAQHAGYETNIKFARGFFRNELRRTERDAFEKDTVFWQQIRPMGMQKDELLFIKRQDSILAYHSSSEYLEEQDSIANQLGIEEIMLTGISFRDRARKVRFYFSPLIEQPQPWGVGGYRHSLSVYATKVFPKANQLFVNATADYGFSNNDLKGQVRLDYLYNPRKFAKWYVKAGDTYQMVTFNQSFSAILSRSNFVNKVSFGAGHRFEVANGLLLNTEVDFADFRSLEGLTLSDWSQELFGDNNIPQVFDPYRQLTTTIRVTYTPAQKYQMEPYRKVIVGSKWPSFHLTYRKALPGILGSEMNFDFLEIGADQELNIGTIGAGRWNIRAGTFLNAARLQFTDYTFFRGTDPGFFANPVRNFNLLGPTVSTRREYFHGHYLHDFGGLLMKKIPLLRLTKLQTSAGGSVLAIRDGGFLHSEVYGGVFYPIRIRRTRFKVGGVFVTSYSNHNDAILGQWKFGISFFDQMRRRWEY
ncbi:MAG: DUF5686 and carboxypeptidase regulatory-like domain-containing protein [Bacteroidota bacterium]